VTLVVLVLMFVSAALWLFAYGPGQPDPVPGVLPADTADAHAADTEACAAEAALVGKLLDGALTPSDYHRAMAGLAAADAARNPIHVPPDRIG